MRTICLLTLILILSCEPAVHAFSTNNALIGMDAGAGIGFYTGFFGGGILAAAASGSSGYAALGFIPLGMIVGMIYGLAAGTIIGGTIGLCIDDPVTTNAQIQQRK